ncbi:MAG: phosphatidylglycerol lysyltransferase domain-containing protein [Kosmotogaceae bacterium]
MIIILKGGVNINFSKLVLQDFEFVQKFLEEYEVINSKMSFVNLYAYGHFHGPLIERNHRNKLIILSNPEGLEPTFFPPLCELEDLKNTINEMKSYYSSRFNRPLNIKESNEDFIGKISECGFTFSREKVREQWEYIYKVEDLADLYGREMHKKKNRANKFEKEHPDYKFREIEDIDRTRVLDFYDYWCTFRDCKENKNLAFERKALGSLFELKSMNYPVEGGIGFDGSRMVGYVLGTRLNKKVFVVLSEKGELDNKYEGVYAVLNRDIARQIIGKYKLLNLQQDIGLKGLRKSKLSWKPELLLVCDVIHIP